MDIKSILGINKIFKTARTDKKVQINKTDGIKKSDSVQLSGEAKRSAEVKKYISIVKNSSDIRHDKVKMAKEKLQRGDYSNPKILEQTAERLTEKFSIGDKILDSLGEEK